MNIEILSRVNAEKIGICQIFNKVFNNRRNFMTPIIITYFQIDGYFVEVSTSDSTFCGLHMIGFTTLRGIKENREYVDGKIIDELCFCHSSDSKNSIEYTAKQEFHERFEKWRNQNENQNSNS